MPGPEIQSAPRSSWTGVLHTLSGKLLLVLLASLAVVFSLLGFLNIQSQRRHLERVTLETAQRLSNVIIRSTMYSMLHNQREAIYKSINDMAKEPGIEHVRILNDAGLITYSSDPEEIGMYLNNEMQPSAQPPILGNSTFPLEQLKYRNYMSPKGERILAITTPISNEPACSSASCHAHSSSDRILGALDTSVSLARTDAVLASSTRQALFYLILGGLLISGLAVAFVSYMVHDPLLALTMGTRHLREGDLGYQIKVSSHDEFSILAKSFNQMSSRLRDANEEINSWTRKLEERVEEKTQQLRGAQDEMLRVERMASIGKLAAVVAHEINNPLAGILTYSKLLKKRIQRSNDPDKESVEMLELMESESRRCGEIVRNLMTFGRPTSMNSAPCNVNTILERCTKLVQPQLKLKNIEPQLLLEEELPIIECDPGQVEQVVLALVINAIDAMPNGGNLTLRTRSIPEAAAIQIVVRDDGVGMPAEVMKNMFEPFFTTKEKGRGLGLGLAISRNIVERHQGRIQVESEPGRGTEFTITLPVQADLVLSNPAAGGREGTKQ